MGRRRQSLRPRLTRHTLFINCDAYWQRVTPLRRLSENCACSVAPFAFAAGDGLDVAGAL
jgi:hypothetical protein